MSGEGVNMRTSSSVSEIPAGIYRGDVEGVESGHCTARIEVRVGPGGCRIVDYEATSDTHGLQHIEHSMLTAGTLHIAFAEAPGVTVFNAGGDGVFEAAGELPMRIHVSYDGEVLTWAWHWGNGPHDIVERSRATCRRADY